MSLIYLESRQGVNTHYYRAQESWTWRRRMLDPVNGISKKEYVDFHSLSLYFLLIFIPFLCSKGRWCQVHTSRAILAYVKRIEGLFITVANFLYVYYFWSFVCCILYGFSLFYSMPCHRMMMMPHVHIAIPFYDHGFWFNPAGNCCYL